MRQQTEGEKKLQSIFNGQQLFNPDSLLITLNCRLKPP